MNDPAIVLGERSTVPPARAIVASPISVPRIAGPTTSATTGDESPTTPVTTASVPTTTPITPIPLARAIRITKKLRTFGGGMPGRADGTAFDPIRPRAIVAPNVVRPVISSGPISDPPCRARW